MKYSLNILFIGGLLVFTSCSNLNNFQKRKYTRGVFRPKMERVHASNVEKEKAMDSGREAIVVVSSKNEVPSRSMESFKEQVSDELLHEETFSKTRKTADEGNESVAITVAGVTEKRSKVKYDPSSKKGTKRARKQLTQSEKNARSSLVLGIVAISFAAFVFGLAFYVAFIPSTFFTVFGLMRFSALLGMLGIFKGSFFYGKDEPLTGKYEKFRRKGLFLSALAVIIWMTFFFI